MNSLRIIPLVIFVMIGTIYSTTVQKKKDIKPFVLVEIKELVGLWQGGSQIVGSAWGDTYSFKSDGTFTYYVSRYNLLSRLVSLKGKYIIDSNILKLKIESRQEYSDGYIERGNPGFEEDWAFRNKKIIEVIQDRNQWEEVFLEWCDKLPKHKCLFMDSRKFYKISNNSDGYK